MFSDIEVRLVLDYRSREIVAQFEADAEVDLVCDRTLRPFTQHVDGSYVLLFTADEVPEHGEYDDVRGFTPSDRYIDLTEAVRDTLVLAVPTRRIAPGAEDVELPTRFGEAAGDEDVDPRWDALKKLRN